MEHRVYTFQKTVFVSGFFCQSIFTKNANTLFYSLFSVSYQIDRAALKNAFVGYFMDAFYKIFLCEKVCRV